MAPALRALQRPAGPPPGRGGAGPGSGAPAQLTRPLSLCWLPPWRAGPGRRHVGPVRALGSGSQRPALGWQRLLQPPEPALQRGHPQDLRGQRVSRCSRAPALPGPPRDAPPTRELGRGRQQAQVGGAGAWSLQLSSSRDWAGAGRGLESPPTPAREGEELILALAQRGLSLLGVHRAPGSARPAPRPPPARGSALGRVGTVMLT